MEATEQNYRIANQIWAILAKENCTVAQAQEILAYVSRKIPCESHVQFPEEPLAEVRQSMTPPTRLTRTRPHCLRRQHHEHWKSH